MCGLVPAERFVESNDSLDYLQCSVGRSYMCSAQQTLAVVTTFSINTFRLQLQPFNLTSNQFSAGTDLWSCDPLVV